MSFTAMTVMTWHNSAATKYKEETMFKHTLVSHQSEAPLLLLLKPTFKVSQTLEVIFPTLASAEYRLPQLLIS